LLIQSNIYNDNAFFFLDTKKKNASAPKICKDYHTFGSPMPGRNYSSSSYRYGFGGHEKMDEISGAGNQVDMGGRYLDTRLGRTSSMDAHASKYPFISPYAYAINNPINAIDPDGKDVILLIWASHDGKIGHAGIAVSNYKEVISRVKENGKWVNKSTMVEDGTYTYRDLWPGGEGAGKKNFDKDVPASYGNKVFTLDQLKNTDVTGSEGYAADGLIQLKTTEMNDFIVKAGLDAHEKYNPNYNGLTNNCSDLCEVGIEYSAGKQLPVDEKLTDKVSATTPNQLYKATKALPNATVIKDPGTKVDNGFLKAVSNGKEDKAQKKID
jgi:RHS repeat-associated protein